jgi:hypothetical protein
MSDREEKFRKTVSEIFPDEIIINDKRYGLNCHMLAVGAHCIDYAIKDRHGAFNWDDPLVRSQCDTDQECINKAWGLLKTAIEKDTKKRMTQKLLRKLSEEECEWLKEHFMLRSIEEKYEKT